MSRIIVAVSAALLLPLLAACGDAGSAPREGSSASADSAQCTRHPETTSDGYTAPGSLLCMGVTARLPYQESSKTRQFPIELTVTSIHRSTDTSFVPSVPDQADNDVWVVDYSVRVEGSGARLSDPFAPFAPLWAEPSGLGVYLEHPKDCLPAAPEKIRAGGPAVKGCGWGSVDPDGTVLGAHWDATLDHRYGRVVGDGPVPPIRWAK